ncbi:hypothetical protein AAHC03_0763 [Spirometra sp. Aus1]
MIRLADYVVVVGFDFEKAHGLESQGRVIQRFPKTDWKNYPYEFRVESFCQPCGWRLTRNRQAPTFFVAYLTDMQGNRYYAACLTFYEAVTSVQMNGANSASAIRTEQDPRSRDLFHTSTSRPHSPSLSPRNGRSNLTPSLHAGATVTDEIADPYLIRPPDLFAPKCLVLLSRHQHVEILKNCLSILYTVFMDAPQEFSLEQIIGNIIGSMEIPPIGGPRTTFSIGANDRQTARPARCSTIPVTHSTVANLFSYLGIHNVLLLFSAMISDQKILLCSQSLSRLTDACHALASILYPLKYGNTYVPILPNDCLEYVSAPTPFLYGIHASYYSRLSDVSEVLVADLDVGSVICPESVSVPPIPQPFLTEAIQSLYQILSPDLLTSDHVYPPRLPPDQPLSPVHADKQIRAVFLRLFASLFAGYRSCLTITRIHPQPVIHFNQSLFLVLRGIREPNEFFDRILSSMRFHQFILERGPPFRVCDVFDEEYDSARSNRRFLLPKYIAEMRCPELDYEAFAEDFRRIVNKLSQKLLDNECDGANPVTNFLQEEATEAHCRLHQRPFPHINSDRVDEFASKAHARRSSSTVVLERQEARFVPRGEQLDRQAFKADLPRDKCRVIREFVADIFNRHITEALKRRNTIRQDLKSQSIRRLFVDELGKQIIPPSGDDNAGTPTATASLVNAHGWRASLNWDQFDLIVGLLDEALRYEDMSYNTVIAPFVVDLATRLSTQLGGIRYYANMTHSIQRHRIWGDLGFWEDVFNEQVNSQLRQLYLYHSGEQQAQKTASPNTFPAYSADLSTLEIAAEELRIGKLRPEEMQITLQMHEEKTLCAQIVHFINLIINFCVPLRAAASVTQGGASGDAFGLLDASNLNPATGPMALQNGWPANAPINQERRDAYFSSSGVRSDAANRRVGTNSPQNHHSERSRRQLETPAAVSTPTVSSVNEFPLHDLVAWLHKFVEKVGAENLLAERCISDLQGKIEGIMEGHLMNLADVYTEVKKIPKTKKPEIVNPTLLNGESLLNLGGYDCLPCQLLADGRAERGDWPLADESLAPLNGAFVAVSSSSSSLPRDLLAEDLENSGTFGRALLPAQGALFVTNYRVIFIGVPKDPYQSNKVVCRSFPVAALHSVKRMGTQRITTIVPTTSAFESSPSMASTRTGGRSGRTVDGGSKRSTPHQTVHGSNGHTTGGSVAVPAAVSSGGVLNGLRSGDLLDVIRLRSLTMQMLRLGFDPDEVTSEAREELRFVLMELRFNARLNLSFNTVVPPSQHQHLKEAEQQTSGSPSVIDQSRAAPLQPTLRHLVGVDADAGSFSSSSASLERSSYGSRSRSQSQIAGGSIGTAHHSSSLLLAPNVDTARSSNLLSDYASDVPPHSTGYLVQSGEVTEVLSALSMTLANVRLPGLDPVISEVFQQSPGYHDLARVGIRASRQYAVNRRLSTSPLPSVRSETSCHSGSYLSKLGLHVAITSANASYDITQTYPCMLIVPSTFTKSRLARVARSHRHGRFPTIVWQHADTRAFLLRGSAFQTKSLFSAMKHTATAVVSGSAPNPEKQTHESDISEISSTNEHVRYFRALADLSPLPGSSMSSTSFVGTPWHLQRCDDSGLSATQSSTTSPSLTTETVPAASPSEVVLRRRLPTDNNGDFLRASRASSKAPFGSIVSLVNPQTSDPFDSAVARNHRFSFYLPDDGSFSLQQFSVSTADSIASLSGQQSKRQLRYKLHSKSGARLTGGVRRALGKLSSGRNSHTKHLTSAQLLSNEERRSVLGSSTQNLGPTTENCFAPSLYVLTEGSVKPLIKSGQFPGVEFVSVEYASHSDIRDAFRKLYKACLPKDSRSRLAAFGGMGGTTSAGGTSAGGSVTAAGSSGVGGEHEPTEKHPGTDASKGADIFMAISESGWLTQVQSLLQLAGVVVDIVGFQGASVAVCLEDGWDAVTQIVSLAQIMMDPSYRTIRGFWSLIEKEWLMFGHCFNQRVGQKSSRRSKDVSPVFLQFLDAVHQLLCQFPLSFEFNDFFLQFLAYHHISNRFHEFKHDCEYERLSHWFNLSISAPPRPDLPADGNSSSHSTAVPSPTAYEANSIWSFIQAQHEEWPIFFNFFFSPERAQKTLIPVTSLVSLDIWKYYLNEDMATGPVYDLDLFCPSYRKQTTRNYDPVLRQGYNNTHVEQTYALLGLREGEDAAGWMEAWLETNLPGADSPRSNTAQLCTDLPLLSEEATADFDRILLQLPHGSTCMESSCSCPLPNTATQAPLNTTLKPPPPSEKSTPANPPDYASAHPPIFSAPSNFNFHGEVTLGSDSANYFSPDDVHSMSSEEMAVSVRTNHIFVDECAEARHAVMMQHRATTMRRLSKVNKAIIGGPGAHIHQASTLVVTGSEDYLNNARHLHASGSLSALPITEDTSESADILFEKPHKFERLKTTLSMSRCDWCQSLVLATSISRGVVRCADCHLYCHEKCAPLVPRTCRGIPSSQPSRHVPRGSGRSSRLPGSNTARPWNHERPTNRGYMDTSQTSTVTSPSPHRDIDVLQLRLAANGFKSPSCSPAYAASLPIAAGNRDLTASMAGSASSGEFNGMACGPPSYASSVAYSSELYKLGHRKMLPTWKPRFFVLDTERHQLRYYDTAQDEVPRGCIDLQDVRSVKLMKNVQSGQRRFQENATFEIETAGRQFRFAAEDPDIARTWVEKIQTSIL